MDTVSSPSLCKEQLRERILACGFDACGFARVHPVADAAVAEYRSWLEAGKHFTMGYMENHQEVRDNPALLLDGARTVICVALNYYPRQLQPADAPQFSYYAYGKDYHDVIRRKLAEVTDYMQSTTGCRCRVCVDSAPIRERYWAQEAGIGFVGRNNQLIIPGKGSYFFLAEIVTTLEFEPDEPCRLRCADCRRCVDACPACALPGDYAALDARSCLSCLTIEYRNELDEKVAEKLGKRVYGCDECQKVCPHNRFAQPTGVDEFVPASEFLSLTFDSLRQMSEDDFRRIFKGSAVKRAKYAGLMRNVEAALRGMEKNGK